MSETLIVYGTCHCGCGEATVIASRSDAAKGAVRGEPRRFVAGHQARGTKQSLETIAKRRASHPGGCVPGCRCGHHSDEARRKVSSAQAGRRASSDTRQKMSQSQRVRHATMTDEQKVARTAHLKAMRDKIEARRTEPSSIELTVREQLDTWGVKWVSGEVICKFMPDLVLPEHGVIIEVQGCYWHGCPDCFPERVDCRHARRDNSKRYVYQRESYTMIEVWEHDILNDVAGAIRKAVQHV